ncbi:MAG: UDP-N-acetyl glucosamine 2-epimerase, partial [Acidobacteriota bacterium]
RSMGLQSDGFAVVTLHRPSNVDDPTTLEGIITALRSISEKLPVIFPVHPRTKASMDRIGLTSEIPDSIRLVEPLGYLEFLSLYSEARLVLTDSGGLQEETTALGIPCLTLRENTERPITVELGTNKVVGTRPEDILSSATPIIDGSSKKAGQVPPLWDGKSAERICDTLLAE